MSTATDFVPGEPALMLTVLRTASDHLDHAVLFERVLALFCSDEDGRQITVTDTPDLRRRVDNAIAHLQMAGLIRVADGGFLSITSLGQAMMMAYPLGIDDGVLCSLPAFRNRIYTDNAPTPQGRPMPSPACGSGFSAGIHAMRLTENPYPSDCRDHEDWLMGWDEALDQAKRERETLDS